jgi:cysteine synthase
VSGTLNDEQLAIEPATGNTGIALVSIVAGRGLPNAATAPRAA